MKHLLVFLLFCTCCMVNAEIYKWTDKNGVVHYEDRQPGKQEKISAAKVEKVELSPITILEDGSVKNTSNEKLGMLAPWLDKAIKFKNDMLRRIDQWRNKTPAVSTQSVNKVEIYTTSWCAACKKAKRWLDQRGIAYKDYDIEKDTSAALRMRKLGGGGGVPFAIINEKTFQGFDPDGYQTALQK